MRIQILPVTIPSYTFTSGEVAADEVSTSSPTPSPSSQPSQPSSPDNAETLLASHDNEQTDTIPEVNDIKIEYHPHSKQPTEIKRLEDYLYGEDLDLGQHIDPEPWSLFGSLDNFEFAEWALEAELNRKQIEVILKIINRLRSGLSELTFSTYDELSQAWTIASQSQHSVLLPDK